MFSACEAVPRLPSFKECLLLQSEKICSDNKRNNSKIRNEFPYTSDMQQKLKEQKEKLEDEESWLFFSQVQEFKVFFR